MSKAQDVTISLLRFMAGFLMLAHGAQKLFGAFGAEQTPPLMSLIGLAGVIEFFGGILVMLGLFTRPAAFLLSGTMAFAYFIGHASKGFWPIVNKGELAALYCFVFLFLAATGGGTYSLDHLIFGRKRDEAS